MSKPDDTLLSQLRFYLDPFSRLGEKKYSYSLPFLATLLAVLSTEYIFKVVLQDTSRLGIVAIFLFMSLIIYFSLRDALRGGFIATAITILYYTHIVINRQQDNLTTSLQTVGVFAVVYLILASVIGWLRTSVDNLIEKETDNIRRLNAVVEQLPAGVVIINKEGVIEMANKQAEKILGIKITAGLKTDQVPLIKTKIKGISLNAKSTLSNLIKTGKTLTGIEYEVIKPNGKKIHIKSSMTVVKNKLGKAIATAAVFDDITEQKETDMRKDDFVNMASHELKTPITSLKIYTDTLVNSYKSSKNGKTTKVIYGLRTQIERLQKLVSELLDVSRLQTGKLTYAKEYFILEELIAETAEALEANKKQKRIKYNSQLNNHVYADRFRISQVINNLLTNALKYSPAKNKVVVNVDNTKGKVIVSVKDSGIGIDKRNYKKIFDRLYQVTDHYEKTFPGLGMGLYIAKEIINHHKGQIWVESKKGKGSTFYFALPVVKNKSYQKNKSRQKSKQRSSYITN